MTTQQALRAPHEYRYALDAAMSVLAQPRTTAVWCDTTYLEAEVRRRLPNWADVGVATSALWIEPQRSLWRTRLATLAAALPNNAPLVVIAPRPLAGRIPERHGWSKDVLGLRLGELHSLLRALRTFGFHISATYGVHSALSIGLNILGQLAERYSRPDLGDRFHFAARLRYCTSSPFAGISTLALLLARKERG